jgi:hypothetical protein
MSNTYRGTYNPERKRGELLKDNFSTGDYFPDRKGLFVDTSGVEAAEQKAAELNAGVRRKAKAEEQKPIVEGLKKAIGKKSGGVISSASKRADGIAVKGKTKGKYI